MKPAELLDLLREAYRDKSALRARHVAGARHVGNFDFNNSYQYVINREDIQLQWLEDAITDMGGTVDRAAEPTLNPPGKGEEAQAWVLRDDSQSAKAFVDRWRDRVEKVTNARHRNMLRVILGETLEHQRFFDLAAAGRNDLLGRSADGARTKGSVIAERWIEQ